MPHVPRLRPSIPSTTTASQPVIRRWMVTAVTQDQDDLLSRHLFEAPCCQIKISLRRVLLYGSIPSMSGTLNTSRTAVGHSPCNICKLVAVDWHVSANAFGQETTLTPPITLPHRPSGATQAALAPLNRDLNRGLDDINDAPRDY